MKVTKLQAAQSHVETAIKLFFEDGDPVSIHTLLFAAVEIIHGLHKRATGKRLFFENDAMKSRPGMVRKVKDWGAFMKHGREYELDRVLDFNPDSNLVLFSACIAGLGTIKAPPTQLELALLDWLLIHQPDFVPASEIEKRPTGKALAQLRLISKQEFLEHFIKFDYLRI